MADLNARCIFDRGLVAMVDGNFKDAVVFFQRAWTVERERRTRRSGMRYLSYYGLSLARAGGPPLTAIESCQQAARHDPQDPDLQLNLGLVYLFYADISGAMRAFERGLELAPFHPLLQRELERGTRRRPPVLGRLHRDHPLNRLLGRLRQAIGRRSFPGELSRDARAV